MSSLHVHLGFEVTDGVQRPSLTRVEIPIRHMAVTGQTQESGKTTALEGLITRSGLPAIAFLTKRGEASFTSAHQIKPFFQERADWQFVESILESTMKQRMKFERAWTVKACRGAHTLAEVQGNVARLQASSKRSMDQDLYMLLGEYLDKVVPLIRSLPKSPNVVISDGLNVMDLRSYPEELQSLVISSTLDHIHKTANGVITVIPEAWKFIPQGRNTPVHVVAEKLVREGAGLKNYVWIDSQDMAGVDKVLLRGCPVWLIGVQREANELKRALANMPAGLKKPKAEAVATLGLGQFYACYGNEIRKAYVQPAWMDETVAGTIAAGRLDVHSVTPPHTTKAKQPAQAGTRPVESPAGSSASAPGSPVSAMPQTIAPHVHTRQCWDDPGAAHGRPFKVCGQFSAEELAEFAQEEEAMPDQETIAAIRLAIKDGAKDTALRLFDSVFGGNGEPQAQPLHAMARSYTPAESFDNEQLYQAFKARLMKEAPAVLNLLTIKPEINVSFRRQTLSLDTDTLKGRIAVLISKGFFDSVTSNKQTLDELERRGWRSAQPRVSEAFAELCKLGFLYREGGGYRVVEGMKVNVIAA